MEFVGNFKKVKNVHAIAFIIISLIKNKIQAFIKIRGWTEIKILFVDFFNMEIVKKDLIAHFSISFHSSH